MGLDGAGFQIDETDIAAHGAAWPRRAVDRFGLAQAPANRGELAIGREGQRKDFAFVTGPNLAPQNLERLARRCFPCADRFIVACRNENASIGIKGDPANFCGVPTDIEFGDGI